MAERAGQLPGDRVGDDHRRQLTAGDHVRADRDHVGRKVLVHPLVEPLVAPAQKRDVLLGRQLGRKRVVELAAAWAPARPCAGRAAPPAPYAASSAASTTSTRSTIPAPPPYGESSTCPPVSGVVSRQWKVRSSVPGLEHVRHVPLAPKPLEPLGKQGEDVDAHDARTLAAD